jgi:hypothetical protein
MLSYIIPLGIFLSPDVIVNVEMQIFISSFYLRLLVIDTSRLTSRLFFSFFFFDSLPNKQQLEMEDGDAIDAMLEQLGGCF